MTDYYDDSIYEQPETPRQEQEASHQEPEQSMPQMPHTPKKEKKNGKGAVSLVLCCALVGGGCGIGGAFIGNSLANKNQPTTVYSDGVSTIMKGVRETSTLQVQQIDSSKVLTGAEVYAANVNSTVGIVTSLVTTNFWGQQTTGAAAGSGFIFSDDGYILTNYHVVKGATSITVSTYDGTKYDAQLIGYDESNDVAVLKIDAAGLTPVVIGDSDKLNVGDSVVAIGNPLGELTFSETSGIVSALNREVTMSSDTTMDLIQTDCAINSGNSGGALFNMYGEVVGITNAKYSSSSSSSSASAPSVNSSGDRSAAVSSGNATSSSSSRSVTSTVATRLSLTFMTRTPRVERPIRLIESACIRMIVPPVVMIIMSLSSDTNFRLTSSPVFSLKMPALIPLPPRLWRR